MIPRMGVLLRMSASSLLRTSIALAKFPENVRADAVADQTDPNPGLATAEQGEEWFERVTERLAKFVGEVIDGGRQSEAPPFHP